MGYCVTLLEIDVLIPGNRVRAAIEAARGFIQIRPYAWVSRTECEEALAEEDLSLFLLEFGYESDWFEDRSDLEKLASLHNDPPDLLVNGYRHSKWGDDEFLWQMMAPFVFEGSFMSWMGEDTTFWRYEFDGTCMTERTGYIEWE